MRQLTLRIVEKPWGQRNLASPFSRYQARTDPIGEIWFQDPDDDDPELLVKYLFTAERLSIQVHPADAEARKAGFARGKDEAWFILSAEPDAVIGLGPVRPIDKRELRSAAEHGSIEGLIDWRAVKAGDFIYSPAGTIHAIGAGITLIEIQQFLDLTYRLYDYGRPRELHLDAASAVAHLLPFKAFAEPGELPGREVLAQGSAFVVERWRKRFQGMLDGSPDRPLLLVALRNGCVADGRPLDPGSVWRCEYPAALVLAEGADMLVAYAGSLPVSDLLSAPLG